MIQRIQTVYLFFAVVLMGCLCYFPYATFIIDGVELKLSAFSLQQIGGGAELTIWQGIIFGLATIIPLITIFLFKKRNLQIRLCGVEIVLLLGSIAFMAFYFFHLRATISGTIVASSLYFISIAPLGAIILVVMAMKGIFRDELIIRSYNRIR